jgi:hypothetical protein
MRPVWLLSGLVLVVAAVAAWAQEDNPCRADVERLCAGVEPGAGRLRACVRSHLEELSPGCRARLEEARGAFRRGFGRRGILACRAELETLCKDVAPGAGRWRRCLSENAAQLKPPCRHLLDSLPAP